eukprot:jgi/Bigna1/126307/aug1.2_g1015
MASGASRQGCFVGVKDATAAIANDKGVDLFEKGKLSQALLCFAVALGLPGSEYSIDTALANFRSLKGDLLRDAASVPPYATSISEADEQADLIARTWDELVDMMKAYNITTPAEMARLRTPYDVYLLHGQLICQKDEAEKAIGSFLQSIRVNRNMDALLLLGRIYMGQGRHHLAFQALIEAMEILAMSEAQHSLLDNYGETMGGRRTARMYAPDLR